MSDEAWLELSQLLVMQSPGIKTRLLNTLRHIHPEEQSNWIERYDELQSNQQQQRQRQYNSNTTTNRNEPQYNNGNNASSSFIEKNPNCLVHHNFPQQQMAWTNGGNHQQQQNNRYYKGKYNLKLTILFVDNEKDFEFMLNYLQVSL